MNKLLKLIILLGMGISLQGQNLVLQNGRVSVYQNTSTIETWITNYSSRTIKIFTFTEQ